MLPVKWFATLLLCKKYNNNDHSVCQIFLIHFTMMYKGFVVNICNSSDFVANFKIPFPFLSKFAFHAQWDFFFCKIIVVEAF